MRVEPTTLDGERVSLEPTTPGHIPSLCGIGFEPSQWQWTTTNITDSDAMMRYIEDALKEQDAGRSLPFVTKDKNSGMVVGSTRFGNIDQANRKAEIGWTWLAPAWQRTSVNTEAKVLTLTHGFESWNCIRVEFKTDALNERSRNAILRLGAKQEGILRNHMITDSGRFRNSA